ncbi:MAG: NADPH:quinone oxidoreductase family protein [Betaproteobacteria bacterium]|nr:NADPH:quinone oxidoreductase family protein [Betaproteobacteria bacterium]
MRACVLKAFGSVDNLGIEEIVDPVPGVGQVVIDVDAAGITHGEFLVIQGKYQTLPPLPFVPGKELAGVVTAVGKDVTVLRPGDRVLGIAESGAYGERASVEEKDCYLLPDAIPFVHAAAMGIAYQTAYFALMDSGRYREGETVLINGASGGVGLAAVQLAKAKGATVLAGLTTPAKAALVKANGADHVVDLSQRNPEESLREQVYAVTGERGADVIIDMIGADVFDASLRALAWRGRMVTVGFLGGRVPLIKANYLLIKNITVSGLFWMTYRNRLAQEVRDVYQELFRLYSAGKLKPVVMEVFALDDIHLAFARLSKRQMQGRVMLTPRSQEQRRDKTAVSRPQP